MYLQMDPIGVTGRYGREAIVDSQDVVPGIVVDVGDGGTFAIRFKMGGRDCGRRPLVRLFRGVVAFVAATVVSFLSLSPLSRPEPRLLFV